MVGIEQHRRGAFGSGDLGEDGWMGALDLEKTDGLEPGLGQKVGYRAGRPTDLGRVEIGSTYRRNPDEVLECRLKRREQVIDGQAKIFVHGQKATALREGFRRPAWRRGLPSTLR